MDIDDLVQDQYDVRRYPKRYGRWLLASTVLVIFAAITVLFLRAYAGRPPVEWFLVAGVPVAWAIWELVTHEHPRRVIPRD